MEVRRSPRARRIRAQVDPRTGEVTLVLPRWATQHHAEHALAELRPWIDRRLAEVAERHAQLAARGPVLPYLGAELALRAQDGRERVARRGDELLVPAEPAAAAAALERWLRRQARTEVLARLDPACAALGVSYSRLTIRDQRTRWGSCSARGALAFNWRLVLAPEEVLDYVVWHEACHLRHLDHSLRFWGLLAEHRPGYAVPKRWLREHGATLQLALPAAA
jgi:predicted metal-dependent hydrolase